MKISGAEYEKMILGLNLNKNRKMIWISTLVAVVGSFIVSMLIQNDIYFNVIISIFAGAGTCFVVRKMLVDGVNKANFVKDIVGVEQELREDRIMEKVVKRDGTVNSGEYYYKDIAFVREDKACFYLYLSSTAALIINKGKLDDLDSFKRKLKENNLLK